MPCLQIGPLNIIALVSLMSKSDDSVFVNPFSDDSSMATSATWADASAKYSRELLDAALRTKEQLNSLLPEERAAEAARLSLMQQQNAPRRGSDSHRISKRDLIVSFRAAFQGFVVSLIDSAPSEISVVSLENVNALATWNKLQTADSTAYLTVTGLQVDNMVPNAPFPVAVFPLESKRTAQSGDDAFDSSNQSTAPLLVIGVAFAPKHSSGIVCFKSVTVAPRNLALNVDLAFLVRLQKYALDIQNHFHRHTNVDYTAAIPLPDIISRAKELEEAANASVGRQKFYFGGLTILPCNIKLSVAPARALTQSQASLEGPEAAAIHQAVRKGDIRLGDTAGLFGVKVGHRNATPLAVVRGVFKSIVVDALLRLDGANLNFAGVVLRNHTSSSSQLATLLGAHYLSSLRQNLPALLGSLAAFGNPLGLVRGLGDGVR